MEPKEYYIALARKVLRQRWPEAIGAFAGGSILRGQGKPQSDIDLIVLLPKVERAEKWWLREKGVPFDVFCHDEQTLKHFVAADFADRRLVLLNIMNDAELIGVAPELRKWQRYARAVLRRPLPALDNDERMRWRYRLMDRLEDYEDAACPLEQAAIACELYQELNDVLCLLANIRLGNSKWRGRRAKEANAVVAWELWQAFGHDLRHPAGKRLLPLGKEFLAKLGGPLVKPEVNRAPLHMRQEKLKLFQAVSV